jgi:hypothetical protein
MAFVLVWAGVMIKEKVEDRKERKRNKQADIDKKYRELQEETQRRLSRTGSGGLISIESDPEGSGVEDERTRTSEEVRRENDVRRKEDEKRAKRRHLSRILG